MHPTHPLDLAEVTPADTLRCAAVYLQRHGWIQGNYYAADDNGDLVHTYPPACLLGAIGMAVHGYACDDPQDPELPAWRDFQAARAILNAHLIETEPAWAESPEETIADWNDRWAGTPTNVVAALTNAAEAWEHRHQGGAR